MRADDRRTESLSLATARFPDRDARLAFLRQVQLWNSVEGLPVVLAQSLADGVRVRIETVTSAKRGIVRLIDAFGGLVVEDPPPPADSANRAGEQRPVRLA